MNTSKPLEAEINPVQDDLPNVATKLGVKDYQERDKITPTEEQLLRINGELDDDGNSYLIRFTKLGKSDVVEFLLKFDGIDVNHENNDYEAAVDVAINEKQDLCLLKLLEADALFPPSLDADDIDNEELKTFLRMREKLHRDIEAGDLKSVEDALRDQKSSIYLSKSNESALSWAASCEQIEIFAFLLGKGAKFLDQDEEDDCVIDDYRLEKLNNLRQDQLLKIENYHVQKLLYRSKSPQALTKRRYDLMKSIYDYLNQFELISLIMKVLEYDDCDVVFDFENEHTNNMYRKEDIYAYGLTVRSMKRIFIGAKKCLSTEGVCKEVAGTLAHELCHMAMHVLYRNGARPYAATEESGSLGQEYRSVVKEISKSVEEKKTDIDGIIREVFNYHRDQWECELIVRVPHILAAYGKEIGEHRLNSQAKGLYDFYLNHIVRDSSGYTNPAYFKRALCSIESLHTYHGCISEDDKQRNPFKVPIKSFRGNLVQRGIMQVLTTNIVKLGALHIYHEMKMTERYQIDKSCLFFRLDCFLKNFKDILKAFDCNVCRLMVLVCNEERVDIDDTVTYFYDMDIASRNKEIILVHKKCEMLNKVTELPGESFDYFWTDFSESYQEECLKRTVNFKGNETRLNEWIDAENLSKLIQSEDISRLIAEDPLVIWDGRKNDYQVYESYYYIERDLAKVIVDTTFFSELPKSTRIYITGLSKEESAELSLDENRLQWLIDDKKKINNSKNIFIREKKRRSSTQ